MRMADVFGEDYGRMVARSQQLGPLGGRTVAEALDAGLPPREAWEALCDHMQIPEADRFGKVRPLRRGSIDD